MTVSASHSLLPYCHIACIVYCYSYSYHFIDCIIRCQFHLQVRQVLAYNFITVMGRSSKSAKWAVLQKSDNFLKRAG